MKIEGWMAAASLWALPHVAHAQADTGRFIVTGVVVNPVLTPGQAFYYDDDPRLVGRTVDIARDRLAINVSRNICQGIRRTMARLTLADIWRGGMVPNSTGPQRRSGLVSARLPAANAPLATTTYTCIRAAARTKEEGDATGNWHLSVSFPFDRDRRGLFWGGGRNAHFNAGLDLAQGEAEFRLQ